MQPGRFCVFAYSFFGLSHWLSGDYNYYYCGGDIYGGYYGDPDFGDCETASGLSVTFDVAYGEDYYGYEWGFGLIGFDFNASTSPGSEEVSPYNASGYTGICVDYSSSGQVLLVATTPYDLDGDAYYQTLEESGSCYSWAYFVKNTWSSNWEFTPSAIRSIQFKVEDPGETTFSVSRVYFY
jgi:hypothetical protein